MALTEKTIYNIIERGHGHKLDPDTLSPIQQLHMAAFWPTTDRFNLIRKYHARLLTAKNLDHNAQLKIAQQKDAPENTLELLKRPDLHPLAKDAGLARLNKTEYTNFDGVREMAIQSVFRMQNYHNKMTGGA